MTDSSLVLPYDVEGLLVDVIKRRHPEHLAKAERQRGKRAKTFEQFRTVTRMSDAQALRLAGDTVPAVLLGVIGAPEFKRNEDDGIDALFQVGMQVTVMGQKRADTLYRRDVMAWTLVECVLQRVPRRGLINSVRLVDYEPLSEADKQRTLGDARLIWEVGAKDVVSVTGLPADDRNVPPEVGGPPPDPYTPPEEPPIATGVGVTIDRRPLVE